MMHEIHGKFTQLFIAHERAIYGFVFSLLPSPVDADDVLQETMTQLWEHFEAYDHSRPFLPWAYRFAYRQVLAHRRKQSVRRKFFSDVVVEALAREHPPEEDWREQRREALQQCLTRLREDERRLIQNRYSDELTLVELAEQMGRTVNSLYK